LTLIDSRQYCKLMDLSPQYCVNIAPVTLRKCMSNLKHHICARAFASPTTISTLVQHPVERVRVTQIDTPRHNLETSTRDVVVLHPPTRAQRLRSVGSAVLCEFISLPLNCQILSCPGVSNVNQSSTGPSFLRLPRDLRHHS
jgi:hypothetical protein